MLAVVQQQQQAPPAEGLGEGAQQGPAGLLRHLQHLRHHLRHQGRVGRGPSSASQIPSGYGTPSGQPAGPPGATAAASPAPASGAPASGAPASRPGGPAPGPEARPASTARSVPTWRAMRVLPQPPGPVRVTRRAFRSRSSTAARSASRPMQVVSVAGRLVGGRAEGRWGSRPCSSTGRRRGGRRAASSNAPRRAGQVEHRHQAGGRVRVGAALAALQVLDRPHAQPGPLGQGVLGQAGDQAVLAAAGSGRVPAPPSTASSASRHTVPLPGPTGVGARQHCSTPRRRARPLGICSTPELDRLFSHCWRAWCWRS